MRNGFPGRGLAIALGFSLSAQAWPPPIVNIVAQEHPPETPQTKTIIKVKTYVSPELVFQETPGPEEEIDLSSKAPLMVDLLNIIASSPQGRPKVEKFLREWKGGYEVKRVTAAQLAAEEEAMGLYRRTKEGRVITIAKDREVGGNALVLYEEIFHSQDPRLPFYDRDQEREEKVTLEALKGVLAHIPRATREAWDENISPPEIIAAAHKANCPEAELKAYIAAEATLETNNDIRTFEAERRAADEVIALVRDLHESFPNYALYNRDASDFEAHPHAKIGPVTDEKLAERYELNKGVIANYIKTGDYPVRVSDAFCGRYLNAVRSRAH